jgi:hypothetical protein
MSTTFVLSSERNEEALRNKNSEDNRHFMQMIVLLVKNCPVAFSGSRYWLLWV